MQRKMYKIVPAERQSHPKETITKTAVNHQKTAYSGHFGTPGETRTHYIPLRRRTLYPGEVRGLIQQIFKFQAPQDSNELPLRSSPDRALSGDTQCREILEIQGFSAFHSPDFTAL